MFWVDPLAVPLRFDSDARGAIWRAGEWLLPEAVLTGDDPTSRAQRPALVDVYLPDTHLLVRKLRFPAAAYKSFRQAAELDLMRRTPFKPAEIVWSVTPPTRQEGNVTGLQFIARLPELDFIRQRLKRLGFSVRRVLVEQHNLVLAEFPDGRERRRIVWRGVNLALAGVVLAGLAFLWLAPAFDARRTILQDEPYAEILRSEAVALRTQVEAARRQNTDLDDFVGAVIHKMRLVEVLRELTVALPDSAWVSEFNFTPQAATMVGESRGSAAELVLGLGSQRFFSDPRLTGPVSRTAEGNERFEVTVGLGRR